MKDVMLSSSVTVADYLQFEDDKARDKIATFIRERFTERYIKPLLVDPAKKHGFCTMAICCLMIEALESFWQSWVDTQGRSKKAFHKFFQRCSEHNSELGIFSDQANNFYEGVRCGILHQAETTRGWRIRREGTLFNPSTKTINATHFHKDLERELKFYSDTLKQSTWSSGIWRNLREKMKAVIDNCRQSPE